MLILSQIQSAISNEKPIKKVLAKKGVKTTCCKKYKKDNRCKRCPCFDLLQKAS